VTKNAIIEKKRLRGWMSLALGVSGVLGTVGCAGGPGSGGSLKVKRIAAVAEPPANVSAYFTVKTKTGEALTDLDVANFKVFEDNKLVSEKKAKRALLDSRPNEAQYVLVLLDVGGPVVDGEDFPDLVTGVGRLVETTSHTADVAVSIFDGEEEIVPMLGFGASGEKAAIEALRHFRPRNRNSNFNGALIQGLDVLEKQLSNATAPFRYATLVLITDRGDLAKKVPLEFMTKRLAATPVSIHVIAVGPKVNPLEMQPIGKAGLFTSAEGKDFAKGLTLTAKKIEDATAGHYMFSYCSNKREGSHTLTLVVDTQEDRGRLIYKFKADNFKSGCAPKHRPVFEKAEKADDKDKE
jgi:hypothetical protein